MTISAADVDTIYFLFQVVYLEAQGDGAVFSSLTNGPHPLYVPLIMLFLDCILYLLLAIYLDQVLPGELGTQCGIFLNESFVPESI